MYFISRRHFAVITFLCLILLSSQMVSAVNKDDWQPISPAELAMKTPKVEPNADAEAIFWEVRVDDSSQDLIMKNYIRVKIFTEKGREKYSKIDIPFVKGIKIKDIEARVVKPDGSIIELAEEDVFEREIVKTNKVKVKAKSFAIPNIEPGVIVEYKYKEVRKSSWASNMRMMFQHDIPIQNITYYFKPYDNTRYFTFNMEDNKFVKDKGGFYRASMTNVPALKEEARMPPEDEVRSWLLLYYTDDKKGDAMNFWSRAGGLIVRIFDIKETLKPDKDIKNAVAEITAGANTPDEKLAKIHEFCKTQIRNLTYDASLTDEQKEEIKPNKSAEETFKKKQGTDDEINSLFASLADALGFETRIAFGGDKSEKFFNISQAHPSFIHYSAVAVKVGDRWKYYDPGSYFTSYGTLPWFEEDTAVLLLGYKDFVTTQTTFSDYKNSVAKRTAKLKLSEDGTLEGDVRIEYTGHLAYQYKMNNYDDSQNQREESLKEAVKETLSTAELSGIKIENAADPEKPFIYNYKIRVPNYAQKTGKRLFLQPGFFTANSKPLFSAADRKHDIFFQFPWSENDEVEIELPKGFTLDNADAPGGINDPQRISSLDVNIKVNNTANLLTYKRQFYFGSGGRVLFQVGAYAPVKALFDAFNKADTHTITLKQAN